ncbi:oxidoreductase, short-chain dehydrogenase/reductase [Legionella steigerwaltii]|uniref:Oxidoreductase, short-chain dehydrogenase/reductase n=1 Tax=Legionella steigerwaltii TaxID=460 RepID=A0A378LAL3_9GAMM|nr:SDR family oxidoreductase [Legionella steigerwaltii]KTD78556.1 oxidoreductase, short-chain dehydrogenase/reductase [Legionella steigerwaltii]STY24085.1 oxidoreductase, short-chain dehydrogenase/reductase [Legionella steigerwaltii]
MRFNGKTVLVTGGSSGIGFAVAKRVTDEGGRVIITGRNQKNLDAAVKKLGKTAQSIASDASRIRDIDALFSFIKKNVGPIDGLFANAGTVIFEPVEEVTEEHFDKLMNTNVKSVFFTLQKAIPHFADGASIVINSSIAGSTGRPTASVYSATKAAVRSMARTFAASLVARKIRVNAISPGPIDTPLWFVEGGLPADQVNKILDDIKVSNPMKRFGSAEEVAAAVAFLLASESSYITGSELFVDGGVTQL